MLNKLIRIVKCTRIYDDDTGNFYNLHGGFGTTGLQQCENYSIRVSKTLVSFVLFLF